MYRFFAGISSLAALLFLCAPATGAEQTDAARAPALPEIMVTASAEPAEVQKLPVTVQVISAEQLERAGASTLDQVLERYVPGNGVIQPGAYAAVGLRGFRSYRSAGTTLGDGVLILIDGHRSGIANPATVPMANVERIEIMRGPASVLYGGSAMGGVVNIITKRGKGKATGQIGAEYGSFHRRRVEAGISGGLDDDRWGYALAMQGTASSDYKDGDGRRYVNSHAKNGGISGSVTYRPDEEASISVVTALNAVGDTGSPGGYYAYGLTPYDQVRDAYQYLALEYEDRLENDVTLRGSLYGSRNRYNYMWDGDYGAGNSTYRGDTFGGRMVAGLPVADFGRLAIGAEYAFMRENTYGTSVSQPNAEYDILGLFAEHSVNVGDVSVRYGLRYDLYRESLKHTEGLADVHADSKTYNHVSWSAGATWWALDWLGVRVAGATAYVPPTAKNLAGDFYTSGMWGQHYIGNPDLNAEKSITGEAGVELDFGSLRGSIAYFYTKYTDRITTVTLPNYDITFRNTGDQRLAGFNASLNYSRQYELGLPEKLGFSLYGSGEFYTERRDREGNAAGSIAMYVPQYSAVAGIGIGYGMFWLDVNGRFTGDQYQDEFTNYSTVRMGSFAIWNSRLTVRPTERLRVYLDVSNIGDKQYAYTYDYPLPGRAVSVGFAYTF